MTHPLWPLFDLRIRTRRLVLRLPTDDELVELAAVARAGTHAPGEMPFGIAWSTLPSPAFERSFVQHHWAMRGSWSPASWNLNLAAFLDGRPIGSQSLHGPDFPVLRRVGTGSWLGQPYQGRGYGTEMRAAVLAFAFDWLGAEVATTEAFTDNARSAGVSRSLGYEENGIGRLAPEGVPRDTRRFRMTAAGWRSRPRPAIVVEGFEACRGLFGLPDDEAAGGGGGGRAPGESR